MDRVYTSGAAATPPAPPASPSNGYPRAKSLSTGDPATIPGPYWYYMITESLLRVLIDAGVTPNHEDHTLLSQAIQSIVASGLPDLVDASVADKGIIQLASTAESEALANALKAITPATLAAGLAAAFSGSNRSFSSAGFQKLPSGLILQWQTTAVVNSNSSVAITFPIAFPTACLGVFPAIDYAGTTTHDAYSSGNRTTTGCTIYANGAGGDPAFVLSIGY